MRKRLITAVLAAGIAMPPIALGITGAASASETPGRPAATASAQTSMPAVQPSYCERYVNTWQDGVKVVKCAVEHLPDTLHQWQDQWHATNG